METTSNYSNTNDQGKENNPLKKWVILLGILAGVFFATTMYFGFFAKPVLNKEFTKVENSNMELQAELDSLLAEHEKIKSQYGSLSDQLSEKDSIIAPFYDIELDTGVIISIIVMLRKEWENRPFITPFQYNVRNEGITL